MFQLGMDTRFSVIFMLELPCDEPLIHSNRITVKICDLNNHKENTLGRFTKEKTQITKKMCSFKLMDKFTSTNWNTNSSKFYLCIMPQ